MKLLQQSEFKLPIIKDLGMLTETTIKPTRFVILECPCSNHFKTSVTNGKAKTCCPACAANNQKAAITKPLLQSDYKMQIIKDLGSVNGNRRAIFECTHCHSHFDARASSKAAKNQQLCNTCATSSIRGTDEPLYHIWNGIKQRCYSPARKDYSRYGGVGITMADEWKDDPIAFITWCKANGWNNTLVIDKDIKSAQLGICPPIYAPHTLSFVTPQENAEAASAKAVLQFSLDNTFIAEHDSCTKAALSLGKPKIAKSSIANCCRGVSNTAYGFIWKFK